MTSSFDGLTLPGTIIDNDMGVESGVEVYQLVGGKYTTQAPTDMKFAPTITGFTTDATLLASLMAKVGTTGTLVINDVTYTFCTIVGKISWTQITLPTGDLVPLTHYKYSVQFLQVVDV